ncbi:MAG: hypothetical protein ACFE8E_11085 [Candidatus Hodarchaeota archaeon]
MVTTLLKKIRSFQLRISKFKNFLFFAIIHKKLNLKWIAKKFLLIFKIIDIGDKVVPWIPIKAKIWLDKTLKADMILYEFGSGLSTLYFSTKVKKVISIEHNKKWYNLMKNELKSKAINNCEYFLEEPELINAKNSRLAEIEYTSDLKDYQGFHFRRYVENIDRYPDNSFDVVFIDGRVRIDCILHSINKIKTGGFLILDNSDEKRYKLAQKVLKSYKNFKIFDIGLLNPYSKYSKTSFWEMTIWKIN